MAGGGGGQAGNSREREEPASKGPGVGCRELGRESFLPTAEGSTGERGEYCRGEVWRAGRFCPALQTMVRNEDFILSVSRSHLLEAPSWGDTRDPIYILNRGLWLPCKKECLAGGDARLEAGREGGGGCRNHDAWAPGSLSRKGELDSPYILKEQPTRLADRLT